MSRVKAEMPEPFELDKIKVTSKGRFAFMWDGERYECIDLDQDDVKDASAKLAGVDASDEGQLVGMLRYLLGDEQYERLDASDLTFTRTHFETLVDKWAAHHELSVPKSSGSRRSSRTRTIR